MSLQVFTGCMFSGKSTNLIREINKFTDINKNNKALIITHQFDTRDITNVISSHSSAYKGLSSNIDTLSCQQLSTVDVTNYTIIGIDEINFFSDEDDLIKTIKSWLLYEKHIICAGLDGDAHMNHFGYISRLLPIADSFVKLNAICNICIKELLEKGETITPINTTPAPFTKKITNDETIIDVGGSDKYIAVCRKHH
jgi:thymidine kinase